MLKDFFAGKIESAGMVWTSRQAAACLPICALTAEQQENLADRAWEVYVWEGLWERSDHPESVPRPIVVPDRDQIPH